jgi:hypothetical protein
MTSKSLENVLLSLEDEHSSFVRANLKKDGGVVIFFHKSNNTTIVVQLPVYFSQTKWRIGLQLSQENISEETRILISEWAHAIKKWYEEHSDFRLDFLTGSKTFSSFDPESVKESLKEAVEKAYRDSFSPPPRKRKTGHTPLYHEPAQELVIVGRDALLAGDILKMLKIGRLEKAAYGYLPKESYKCFFLSSFLSSNRSFLMTFTNLLQSLGFNAILIE